MHEKNLQWIGLILIGILCLLAMGRSFSSPNTQKRISIIQIVEHPALNETQKGIMDELEGHSIKIQFQSAQGNSALAAQIATQYVGSSPDALVGIGTPAAQALLAADQRLKIPIVFSSVTDPLGSKLVPELTNPKGMVTGVSNFIEPEPQLAFFKEILPKLKTLGIIYNPGEANSVALIAKMQQAAKTQHLELILAPANNTTEIPQAAQSLAHKVQAIFINNDNTALSAFDSIVKISNQASIPVFCSDTDMIKHGALAALGPNQYEIGKQTGKILLQILNGEKPANISVQFPLKLEKKINKNQAKKLHILIPDTIRETHE